MAHRKQYSIIRCIQCGEPFVKETRYVRAALKKNRLNFCSLRCTMLYNRSHDIRCNIQERHKIKSQQPQVKKIAEWQDKNLSDDDWYREVFLKKFGSG